MRVSRFLAVGVLVALVLLLTPLVPVGWGISGRAAALGTPSTCELIVNGDFESPAIPSGTGEIVTPTSWSGGVGLSNPGGDQLIRAMLNTLSQTFSTAGLGGQTLTASFELTSYANATTVTLGEQSGTFNTGGATLRLALTYPLPNPAPATTTLSFSAGSPDLDDVSVTAPVCPPNQAPIVSPNPVSVTTNEDTAALVTIAATDPDDDALTYTATEPARGSVTGTGPSFTYTPDADLSGADTFDVTVSDGTVSTVVTVNVTVNSVNDPPSISGGVTTVEYTVNERRSGGSTLTIPLSLPLVDPEGDLLVLEIAAPEDQHGRLLGTLAGPNRYSTTYVPVNGYVGPDQYGVLVSDGDGGTLTLLINVTVVNTNDPPVARSETLADSDEDTVRVIPFADLTANDSPGRNDAAAGDFLIVSAVDQPVGGTVRIVGQTVEFIPTAGVSGPASFRYTVRDTYRMTAQASASYTIVDVNDPPVIDDATMPEDITVEATGPGGATVSFTPPTASDPDVGDTVIVTCDPASGATFPLGETDVVCTASDGEDEDTATFTVTVEDTTAPVLTVPASITAEAASSAGATVSYTATASDLVDGSVPPVCSPPSGSLFPIGTTKVRCTATDASGNASAAQTFTVTVRDRTGPVITWVGGPQPNQTYTQGNLPAAPICTGTDTSSDVTQCRVYGYSTAPGTHTLTARARDAEGNNSISTRTYTVTASAPTATPRPPTATPRPTGAPTATPRPTSVPPTATPTRPVRPTTAPVQPTATPVTPVVPPTVAPTRPPRG